MPFVYMMFSVLAWSFFPLLSVWGINQLAIFDYIFWTYVVGLAASFAMLKVIPAWERTPWPDLRRAGRGIWLDIFIGSLSVLLSFVCLLTSFSYISRAGATIVFEVWPIIAMYLTPLLIHKGWERISLKDILFSLMAFAGIALLLYPERQESFFVDAATPLQGWYRLLLPLLGGIFMAVASVLKARVSHLMEGGKPSVDILLKVQVFFSAAVLLLSLPFVFFWPDRPSAYTPESIAAVVVVGIFIHTLGNVAYTMGVLRAAKSNIIVLWYLMPAFAALWLWLAGETAIAPYVVLGSTLIITSNLVIAIRADRSSSYAASIVSLLVCGLYAYFIDGLGMNGYYEALSVPVVFYVILAAFMTDRLVRRDQLEEELAVEVINYIDEQGGKDDAAARALGEHVIGMVTTNNMERLNAHYRAVRNRPESFLKGVHNRLDRLILSKAQGTGFAEIFVLLIVGVLTVVVSMIYRPNVLIADAIAIVLSLTVVFIFFTVLDLADHRRRFYLERDRNGNRMLSAQVTKDTLSERVISVVLIVMVLAALISLLWMKHAQA